MKRARSTTVISGGAAAGLYRAYGTVISTLRGGLYFAAAGGKV